MARTPRYIFGPVYSRRLGVSLGVNNIPYKCCSYSCVYCQLGRTLKLTVERRPFSEPDTIAQEVCGFVSRRHVDYVTFVPDGEPTLDQNLGKAIEAIKAKCDVRIAVLTNASLLWMEDVRYELLGADLVSVKVDAGSEAVWRRVNRPHPGLKFEKLLEGLKLFAEEYKGRLLTETTLARGLNDGDEELERIAEVVGSLRPAKAYISLPLRPPAEKWVRPPSEDRVAAAYTIMSSKGVEVEVLASLEPPPPIKPDYPLSYIIATVAVHPLRLDYALRLAGNMFKDVEELVRALAKHGITVAEYNGVKFLVLRPKNHKA